LLGGRLLCWSGPAVNLTFELSVLSSVW